MSTKRVSYPAEFKTLSDELGQVEAFVSVFGNVDHMGDRVVPGAFKNSIAEWKESGHPVPVIFSHDWSDVWSHIGVVDELEETEKGLKALYTLDIADNPVAAQVYRLLKRRSIKEHSFAYEVREEHRAKDGANDLLELGLFEVGPTLKGANPDTEVLAVKSLLEVEAKAGRSISTKNESLLRDAADAINTVLGSLGDPEEEKQTDGDTGTAKADADTPPVPLRLLELKAQLMKAED